MSTLDDLFDPPKKWGSPVEVERRNRIKLAIYAYAYEFDNNSLVSDEEFDRLALTIDKNVRTGCGSHDAFFQRNFKADTGMWIHKHPFLGKVKAMYETYYK